MCLIKGMRALRFSLFLVPAAFLQVGCASDQKDISNTTVDANGDQISSVPWNKPESWETTGQLGGLSGGSGGGPQ